MASLLEKSQTLIQANLHAMVDSALEKNSVAVLKQYIRDAEKNLDELDRNIDMLLMQDKAELARTAQNELNSTRRMQESYHEQWVRQQREYEALKNARLKLEAKLQTTKQEQKELESLLRLAKSKEKTVKAIKSLDDLDGIGDADIARLGDSIRSRLDKASAHSEMYADRLDSQMDNALGKAELDIQLEERKRRLGLGAAPTASFDEDEDASEASLSS